MTTQATFTTRSNLLDSSWRPNGRRTGTSACWPVTNIVVPIVPIVVKRVMRNVRQEDLSHTDFTDFTDASGKGWEGAALGGGSHGCKRNRKGRSRRPGFTKECQMGIPYLILFFLFPTAVSLCAGFLFPTAVSLCAGRHSNGEIVFLSVLYVA